MFTVLETHDGTQTALMTLACGEESGPFGNEHATSTQVLVMVRGAVDARIEDRRTQLYPGDSVIVARGAQHQFIGTSTQEALMVCVYVPPIYENEPRPPHRYRRDRRGEIYQDAFTENDGAPRTSIERAQELADSADGD